MRPAVRARSLPGVPTPLALAVLLSLIGLTMIYSAGQVDGPSVATGIWRRQVIWLGVALGVFYVASRVPVRYVEWAAPWAYAGAIALLLLDLAVGTGTGARRWLVLGPVSIQVAEVAKLATILMLGRMLSDGRARETRLAQLWKPVAIVLLPFVLVLLQPDLGSAMVFGVILIAALFWAGVPLSSIVMLVSPGVSLLLGFSALAWGLWFLALVAFLYVHRPYIGEGIAVIVANVAAGALTLPIWNRLAEYQQNRLLVFLDPGIDPRGAGWHLTQSRVAIGSGGWLGQGFADGPQKRLAFLPEQHTDFIVSVIGEELGFVGILVCLFLFAWFLRSVIRVARDATDSFGSLVVFSLFAVWFCHLLVNVGMTVGIMPITGVPLPFLSYGGSFLVVLYVGLALVSRVAFEK